MWTKILGIIIVMAFLISFISFPAQAAAPTPAQIQTSIDKGIAWLATIQQPDGRWSIYPYAWGYGETPSFDIATTAIVVLKLEDRAKELGLDPFDTVHYPYAQNIKDGLNYIFNYATTDSYGIHFPICGNSNMYTTGIAMAALSASNHPGEVVPAGKPLVGKTYQEVVQGMLACAAAVQGTVPLYTGGWGYYWPSDDNWVDNSVTGYMTVGLGYAAAAAPHGFGLTLPASIITGLGTWVTTVQVNGGPYDGGSIYNPYYFSTMINTLKTGNLLYEFSMIGVPVSDPRVTRAVSFIDTYWAASAGEGDGDGWLGDYQAMFGMMKGLQAYGINMVGTHDWFGEVSDYIVTNQQPDGHWDSTSGELAGIPSPTFSTALALLTLEKAVPSALSLAPETSTNPGNTQHTATATYLLGGVPQSGVTIQFKVISGPNVGDTGSSITNASGQATFTYTGDGGIGTDVIQATAVNQAGEILASAEVTKQWTGTLDLKFTKTATLAKDADGDGVPSPGDTLKYTALIKNTGNVAANGMDFSDTPDLNTTLLNGTVTTTRGSVLKGNHNGDTTIEVSIGTLLPGGTATITFEVMIHHLWVPWVSNQAITTGTNFASIMSDDPKTPQPNDPTIIQVKVSPGVPGISLWGILAMTLLLGGAVVWVIRGRHIRGETH